MRSLLYIIAVILIIGWAIGTFAYAAGSLAHVLSPSSPSFWAYFAEIQQ